MLTYLVRSASKATVPLAVVDSKSLPGWLKKQPTRTQRWVRSVKFHGKPRQVCAIPAADGQLALIVVGVQDANDLWEYSALPLSLPQGRYQLVPEPATEQADAIALGWSLGCYRFSRYKKDPKKYASLVWPKNAQKARVTAQAEGIGLCRDLINTPAEDMNPAELAAQGKLLAEKHGGKAKILRGEKQLIDYPSVYAVGRAATFEPHLLDLSWGKTSHPKLTLVGKGVVFDSGGLDMKPAAAMKLMKKDMGGAALVLGVAHVIMALKLPVRLRVLVPAVENAVAGNAMRPLDVLRTRKGLSVEVGNTDAEGRLVLSDALTAADEDKPDLIVDAATLTGAARVALGTSLPALFSNDDEAADALLAAGISMGDPLWRLPLHKPYARMLDSAVADLNNISTGGYGGAITAALFLSRFISPSTRWVHIDTMGWNLENRPGRPVGGEALTLRALVEMFIRRYQD